MSGCRTGNVMDFVQRIAPQPGYCKMGDTAWFSVFICHGIWIAFRRYTRDGTRTKVFCDWFGLVALFLNLRSLEESDIYP